MKFARELLGCAKGDVLPRIFEVGTECPPELEEAARALGALEVPADETKTKTAAPEGKAKGAAPENKSA
jgi:hypothetical protein